MFTTITFTVVIIKLTTATVLTVIITTLVVATDNEPSSLPVLSIAAIP